MLSALLQNSSKPNKSHWFVSPEVSERDGIVFTKSESEQSIGYSDAHWAGDQEDRRSTSCYLFKIKLKTGVCGLIHS